MTQETPIENVYLIGETYAHKLKKFLNIHTVYDLLYHFPIRYDDLTNLKIIPQLENGEVATLKGEILSIENIHTRNGKNIQKAWFSDGHDRLQITWFNQKFLINNLPAGTQVQIAGTVKMYMGIPSINSPQYEKINTQYENSQPAQTTHTGRLVPIYPQTFGVSSKWLRARMKSILKFLDNYLSEWMPEEILEKENLIGIVQALRQIHFPDSQNELNKARERLAFDELFCLQLTNQAKKSLWQQKPLRFKLDFDKNIIDEFIKILPFELTDDQIQAISEIQQDLLRDMPMNRLLQGDVGSGKTVVAAAAMYLVHKEKQGLKSILMAPTEVLANQHFKSLKQLLEPLGLKIGLFTGSFKSKGELNDLDILLGTHALLFQELEKLPVSLVIIDEQHRFGVVQRAKLIGEDKLPHVLSMTATPIPRTISLTLYGDLQVSLIKQMPKGRKLIKTWLVPMEKISNSFKWVEQQILEKHTQAYFVYPLIKTSENENFNYLKAATAEFEVVKKLYPHLKIALLHGKIKPKQKLQIMQQFVDKKLDILVSTTVIEVGVDVPNASIMVINSAERFGLAQLHQLRGRVGRGAEQSYCLLLPSDQKSAHSARLKAMTTTNSGIELAELDLKMRGPGSVFGIQQSGYMDLKIANWGDQKLILTSKYWSEKIFPALDNFPLLQNKITNSTIAHIQPN